MPQALSNTHQHHEEVQTAQGVPEQSSTSVNTTQPDESSAVSVEQPAQYSPEQQLLKVAMKRLQALEQYQQLLSSSSSSESSSKELQRQKGDTPAEVAAKIAANRDEVPLLDAALLIAQVGSTAA